MQTTTFILPAHWAPILINADFTGFTDKEEDQYHNFIDSEFGESLFDTVTLANDSEPEFVTHHDARPYGVLACDCLEYTFTH